MQEQTRFRVLIIEDSPTMAAVCARSLAQVGIDCAHATTAESGERLLREAVTSQRPFDGLLLDWLLPGMSGAELLERIGSEPMFEQLAVMIFTESPDERAYALASARPNNDIQLKEDLTLLPFRMRKFLTTYNEMGALGDWRSRQMLRSREQVGGSILFVDDSPTVRAKYRNLLRANGYEVLVASSMDEALAIARREQPELAVIDFFMPGGNGDELCRALTADTRTRDMTLVMHSQRKEVIEDALHAGAIDLIWKDDPINIFLMRIGSIMRTLRAKRQAKELDVLYAATETLGIGVMSPNADGWQAFNPIMQEFAATCGGLDAFDPALEGPMPRRLQSVGGSQRAFQIYPVDAHGDEAVVLVQDVTVMADQASELEHARDQAMASARAKSQFLASMSHEIRTPLNGVLGMLELLRGGKLDTEQRHFVALAMTSAETLMSVIGDVLDFSKIEAGRLELEQTEFPLIDMIEETAQMLAGKAAEKGLELICEIDQQVPTRVTGDPTRLRQVLVNLLGNAIKFTEQGEVCVRATLADREPVQARVELSVSDTGIGIDEQAQRHIFEAFAQADSSTTRRFGGTGLGLAISSKLVEMMGAALRLQSRPGEGSTFSFELVLPCEEISAAASRADAGAEALRGKRVIIVDDNASNRRYLRGLCEHWGMRCDEALDGEQALQRCRQAATGADAYDLILLDCNMPGVDGLEVLAELHTDAATGAIKVILQTSMDDSADVGAATAGTIRLLKPLRRLELLDAMRQLFDASAKDAMPDESAKDEEQARFAGCRVLAVEDNPINQEVIRRLLERLGCKVELSGNGADALSRLSDKPFDIVLMDCEMPVMDGITATEQLRAREGDAEHQVVIALTAHAIPSERERCLSAGMDDYLSKPVRPPVLCDALGRWWHGAAAEAAQGEGVETGQGTGDEAAEPALDQAVLDQLREALGEIDEVLQAALDDLPGRVSALVDAVHAKDAEKVRMLAHSLAGSLSNFGAQRLTADARRLESAAASGDLHDAQQLADSLSAESQRVVDALNDELRDGSQSVPAPERKPSAEEGASP